MKKILAFVLAALLILAVAAAAENNGAEEITARIRNEMIRPEMNTENKLNIEDRLSRDADEAAGLRISEKMRGQIQGLDQASTGSQDGISIVKIAEGALNETTAILNRMRELALEEANGSPDTERSRQQEITELEKEIARIAGETERDQILPANILLPERSPLPETVFDTPERPVEQPIVIDRVISSPTIDRSSINPDLLQEAMNRLCGK